jgi:hypothetical protein
MHPALSREALKSFEYAYALLGRKSCEGRLRELEALDSQTA